MDQDDIYSCKCCLDIYEKPVILDCQHSVCLECARRLLAFHTLNIAKSEPPSVDAYNEEWMENDVILCPVCNEPTALLEEGADSLPPNSKLDLEIQTYFTEQQTIPVCGFGCGKEATLECLMCKCALCDGCSSELHGKPAFKTHEIGHLGELTRRTHPTCLAHNKDLTMFCTICRGMVCVSCITSDETHKGHNCISIEDYASTCTEELSQGMDLLRARHAQLMISFLATEKLLTDITKEHDNFEADVEQVFEIIQHELEAKKMVILSKVHSTRISATGRLTKQARCMLLVADQMDHMAKNIQKTISSSFQPVGALISSKRDMVNALKCFDTKQLRLTPCASTPSYVKLNPELVLEEIIKFDSVVDSNKIEEEEEDLETDNDRDSLPPIPTTPSIPDSPSSL